MGEDARVRQRDGAHRKRPAGAKARNPDLSQIPQSQFQSSLSCRPLFLPTLPFANVNRAFFDPSTECWWQPFIAP
eukprot:scaffold49714_cov54-Phaeocystis_antarctica.AAC.1